MKPPQKNQVICGSNLDVTKPWPSNCIDAICTDPPYGLGFMGKEWDTLIEKTRDSAGGFLRDGKSGSNPYAAARCRHGSDSYQMQEWYYQWALAMLRITKPGGFLLCFGGTRTYHRLACAIEDAGWEIRDCMMWLYGCLSEDTEILTKKGWKLLHKTTKYDKIKVYDTANNIYKWETPQRWNVYRVHKDTAYHLKSDTTDQIVSKEHRCLVEREGKPVFKQAWELSKVERVPVLPPDFYPVGKGFRKILFLFLQWKNKSQAFNKIFSKWSRKEASKQRTKRSLKSCLERWSNLFQKEGKLRKIQNKICQMSKKIFGYGSQRWLCYGTSPIDCTATKQTSLENGGDSPQRPQSRKQFAEQSSAFQNKQKPQTSRVEVSKIKYSGLMFCPTVSTGAFVARRKGKVFITGNSGFPKSHNISKAIDKAKGIEREKLGVAPTSRPDTDVDNQILNWGGHGHKKEQYITAPATDLAQLWNGYGTALKPAWEPILVCMKPLDGTFAHNAEAHGVAGLNIDGGRIGTTDKYSYKKCGGSSFSVGKGIDGTREYPKENHSQGRWPANLILSHHPECKPKYPSDTSFYELDDEYHGPMKCHHDCPEKMLGEPTRFFYCAKTSRKERNMGMEDCDDKLLARSGGAQGAENRGEKEYLQKHIGLNRVAVVKNNHPTVKPLALMKYLCTLLKMPSAEQIILDPFLGSGTTAMACASLGIGFIGIEKELEYCQIAVKRIAAISGETLPVTKNVETFRATTDSVGGSRRPNESLPHVSESRQRIINAASAELRRNRK